MKPEYMQRKGEEYLDWIVRLRERVLEFGSIANTDFELLAILINHIPSLVRMARR